MAIVTFILGYCGSGKTPLARAIQEIQGAECFDESFSQDAARHDELIAHLNDGQDCVVVDIQYCLELGRKAIEEEISERSPLAEIRYEAFVSDIHTANENCRRRSHKGDPDGHIRINERIKDLYKIPASANRHDILPLARLGEQIGLSRWEFPVACSMMEFANQNSGGNPMAAYLLHWIAFNNIYVTIADNTNLRRQLLTDKHTGAPILKEVGSVKMPQLKPIGDRKQLLHTVNWFPDSLKRRMVTHPGVTFFNDRTPRWKGNPIPIGADGCRLNGVIKVGDTICQNMPIWSPITDNIVAKVKAGSASMEDINILAREVACVLYSIRNNIVHGGKRLDDADDEKVVRMALPILEMIVSSFV